MDTTLAFTVIIIVMIIAITVAVFAFVSEFGLA